MPTDQPTVTFLSDYGLHDEFVGVCHAVIARIAPLAILLLGGVICGGGSENAPVNALIALVLLFVAATGLHVRLHALRPPAEQLTGFYLSMSLGGALGGVFAGLLAPILFDWTYEYPLLILAAGMMVPQRAVIGLARRYARWLVIGVMVAVAAIVALGVHGEMVPHGVTALCTVGSIHLQFASVLRPVGVLAGTSMPPLLSQVPPPFLATLCNQVPSSSFLRANPAFNPDSRIRPASRLI